MTRPPELEEKDSTLVTPQKEKSVPQGVPSHLSVGKAQPTTDLKSIPEGVQKVSIPLFPPIM